ncbi:hypothetical protein [Iodobacter fluviatilis]|nr:hypothetical protein [Iodobacter fluviatilis]
MNKSNTTKRVNPVANNKPLESKIKSNGFSDKAAGFGRDLLKIVRYVIFFSLMVLRVPLTFVSHIAIGLSFIIIPVAYFVDAPNKVIYFMLGFDVVLFGLMWFYDSLLFAVSPEKIILGGDAGRYN